MDLKKMLSGKMSKGNVNKVVHYIGDDAARFQLLVTLFLEGPIRVTQYAAWPLSYCIAEHPQLVNKHYTSLIHAAEKASAPDAVKRNVMRLLQFVEIPAKYQGKVANLCFRFLSNSKEAVAIRVFSMTVLANLSKTNPDLIPELKILIEDGMLQGKPAFLSRGRKILKLLTNQAVKNLR